MSLLVLTHCGVSSRPLGLRLLAPPKTFAPTRILKVFSYLYMVKFEILSRLLLSVQAFAFRGRLMSLLELTLCGVSSRPFIPQDKEGFGSDTSHAEKAVFFFKESHACTPSNRWKYSKQLTSLMLNAFVQLRKNSI